jgi:hypothetical protein
MLLSVHATVGAVIGANVSTPLLAFVLGFISHFILDIIPHGDEALIKAYRNDFKNRGMLYLIIFDLASTIILLFLLFYSQKLNFTPIVLWGILGGVIPDVMVAINEITHKHFCRTQKIHCWTHDKISQKLNWTMPLKLGLLLQLLIIYLILK